MTTNIQAKQRLQANEGEDLHQGPFEAYGIKGMKRLPWRKTFKKYSDMEKWLEANDAECFGTRDIEAAKKGKLAPGF